MLLTFTTFDPPPALLYNPHKEQGVNPNAAQFNRVLSTGLRPMDKTLFVRHRGSSMPGIVVEIKPVTVVMTGIEFMQYGNHYLDAAEYLAGKEAGTWFDPLPYQLLCQSLELHLKSFIWMVDQHSRKKIKNKYGHDIEKLWHDAKERGISRYCKPTEARDQTIALVGPYYKARKFAYLDLSMSWESIPHLRAHPEARNVIMRLCKQLRKSLNKPILNAS